MAYLLALLAASAFAVGTVLQQRGALRTAADDARFLAQLLHQPVWFLGALLQAFGWVLQGAALARGPLVVVQALTTLSLVFALPLGNRLTGQQVHRPQVLAAVAVVGGTTMFLAAGQPSGGSSTPSAAAWCGTLLLTIVLVLGLAMAGRRRRGALRAAFFAAAAGVGFAMQAAATKVFVGELGNGAASLLANWSTYVLIASALSGFVFQQSALKTGALAAAMASSNATTLVASTLVGVLVFGEQLARGDNQLIWALCGLALTVLGVVRLATSSERAGSTFVQPST